jgi:bifunctional DNase/RNase
MRARQMIEMELHRILIVERGEEQVIELKEVEGNRRFPIVIGITEALAIDRRVKGMTPPRPMTHELMESLLRAAEVGLAKVVISDLREGTFYARLVLRIGEREVDVDSRPSDAIAIAVRMKAPIFVEERVLQKLGDSHVV